MKKFKQLFRKIYKTVKEKTSNNELIAQKNSSNKPKSNRLARNNHGFPQYISDK